MKRCWIAWVSMLMVLALLLPCAAVADELELVSEPGDLTLADQEEEALDLEIAIDEAELDIPVAPDELSVNELSLDGLSLDEALTLGNDDLEAGADGGEAAAVNKIGGGLALSESSDSGFGEPVTMDCPDQIFASLEMDPNDFDNATGAKTSVMLYTSELVDGEYVDKWEIEDESIITFTYQGSWNNCIITGHKPGTTTVKATTNKGRYGSLTINVEVFEALTIDDAHFPDPSFRYYLLHKLYYSTVEKLNANVIPKAYADGETELDLGWWSRPDGVNKIKSLKGLEYFPALEYIDLDYDTDLTKLDLSHNPKLLKVFCCGNENLTSIDVSKCPKLEILFCDRNGLRTLDVSHCPNLYSLNCSENALTSLNVSGCTRLRALYCDRNKLSKLNLGNNPCLAFLECDHNLFTSLSIAYNPTLIECFSKGGLNYFEEDTVSFIIKRDGVDETASGEEWPYDRNYLTVDQSCAIVFDGTSHVIPPEATPTPTARPTAAPTARPTAAPTARPTAAPTATHVTVKLNKKKASLKAGEKLTLKATVSPSGAKTTLTWSSSNKKVAKVTQEGVVKALKKGTATITVKTSNGAKASCKVIVRAASTKVVLNKTKASLKVGKKLRLKATVKPAGTKTTLTWSSSNKKVATVTQKGVVKAIKPGKATITVKTSKGKKARCKVTVVAKGTSTGTRIDEKHFPDAKFRKYVKKHFDKNKDGVLSKAEIKAVKEIDVSSDGIANLKGVELFTKLIGLNCSNNKLTSLNVSKNTELLELNCSSNKLTKLDVRKNTRLENLYCSNNGMSSLDLNGAFSLKRLCCYENKINSIDIASCSELCRLVNNETPTKDTEGHVQWDKMDDEDDMEISYWCLYIDPSTQVMDGSTVLYNP